MKNKNIIVLLVCIFGFFSFSGISSAATYSSYVRVKPIDGKCAVVKTYFTQLCSQGTPEILPTTPESPYKIWACKGISGGKTVICRALKK